MAHFAELNNGVESEAKGILFLKNLFGQNTTWKQTSYNTFEGVHKLGGTPFRKNFASEGMPYDSGRDAFLQIQPFPSWTFNETSCSWDPPIPRPAFSDTHNRHTWDEETQAWLTGE